MSDTASPTKENRRQFTRVAFDADAEVFTATHTLNVQVTDISLKGALVDIPPNTDWQASMGDHCEIVIHLDGEQSSNIYMHTRVAYVRNNTNIGLVCEHIDIQSIGHLRRLIELNMGDPSLLDRELKALNINGLPD